jgi:hypothetical protein
MIYDGMEVTLHRTRRALDPEILPPNLGLLPEISAHHDRSHPPVVRCGSEADEGDCFYLDFSNVRGAELEVAVLVSVLGLNPVTGGLATLALSVLPQQNYLYFSVDGRQPRRNCYLDGWLFPEIQMVNQFFWTQLRGRADLVAARLGLLVPYRIDTRSNMISVAVFTAVGQIKGVFTSPTRSGPGVGSGGLIHQGINPDRELALHGELAVVRWNSQPEVTFVWEVDVAKKPGRLQMAGNGFFE